MFSREEKTFLAGEIEKLILGLDHPEMPKLRPRFQLKVLGAESWSWADILPNWHFTREAPSETTVWNESARTMLENQIEKIRQLEKRVGDISVERDEAMSERTHLKAKMFRAAEAFEKIISVEPECWDIEVGMGDPSRACGVCATCLATAALAAMRAP